MSYEYPSDYCGEPTHRALLAQTPETLDQLLLVEAPMLRDAYLAYALRQVQAEVASVLFGSVDDETFDRVMSILGQTTADAVGVLDEAVK